MRVFIDHGDRTDRNKARLKYVLDAWGFEKFLAAVEEKLGRKLVRVPAEAIASRARRSTARAHIGVHPQKQAGLQLDRRRAAGRPDDRRSRCAASPTSRAISATAISASRSGRTC